MPTDAELGVIFTGKDNGAGRVIKDVHDEVSGLSGVMKTAGSVAGGFLAANVVQAGVGAFTGFIGDSIAAVKESMQVNAQLEAVLASTGGAAGVTAEHVSKLAASIEKNSLFEDEAILKGQNLLLTFTNVRNDTAKGIEVFDDATRIMVDMAAAMGTDASGAAIQLGKALNDPVAGISALSRVGVSFDAEQKKQIKNFVETGQLAEAQGIILNELNKEFGGSAKAQSDAAGASEKYKDRMNDLQETLGAKMLPIQEKVTMAKVAMVTVIADKVIPKLEELYVKHWPAISAAVEDVVKVIETVWPIASDVISFAADHVIARIEGMIQTITSIIEIVTSVVNLVSAVIHGDWARAWDELKDIAGAAVDLMIGVIKAQLGILPQLMYEGGQKVVTGIWDGIASMSDWLYSKVKSFAGGIYNSVKDGLGSLWPGSPSKAGIAVAEGFGLGLEAGSRAAFTEADRLATGIAQHMAPALEPASWSPGGTSVPTSPADYGRRWAPGDPSMLPGWAPSAGGDTIIEVYLDGALVSRSVEKRQAEASRLAGRGI